VSFVSATESKYWSQTNSIHVEKVVTKEVTKENTESRWRILGSDKDVKASVVQLVQQAVSHMNYS
jgi:hypothetical protein